MLLGSVRQSVSALSSNDIQSILNGTPYYDPTASGSTTCSEAVDVNLSGTGNIQKAYNFFVKQGLTPEQSAGIVGNFDWESGVIPTRNGDPNTEAAEPETNAPTNTWGIAQWTQSSGRIANLEQYAQQNNENIDDLATELSFSWYELSQGTQANTLSYLKQVTGTGIAAVDSSANIIFKDYEGAGDDTLSKRQGLAEAIYTQYSGSADGTIVAAPAGSGGCISTAPGQDTQYMNGFTVYSQCDPQWKDDPYGSGDTITDGCAGPNTIGADGCGPSAMAMIITALTGQQVTPDVTAAYATSQGLYDPGVGSDWSIGPVLAQHWGLTATLVGADEAKITAALEAGGLIIAAGEGSAPFSSEGHFLVIRGVSADGKWEIGDSGNSSTSSQEWDPQLLISNMNAGSVYAITK